MDTISQLMTGVELVFISFGMLFLICRKDYLNPAVIFGLVIGITAWVFFVMGVCHLYPASRSHWWHFIFNHETVASQVLAVYALQMAIAMIAIFITPRKRTNIASSARNFSNVDLRAIMDRSLGNTFILISLFGLLGLCVLHFIFVDHSQLWEYAVYLEFYEPESCRLDNPLLLMFHRAIPILGCLTAGLVACLYGRQKLKVNFIVTSVCWSYLLLITLALNSRFLVAQILLFGVLILSINDKRSRVSRIVGFSSLVCALLAFQFIVSFRDIGIHTTTGFGLGPSFQFMLNGNIFFEDGLSFIIFNLFEGGFSLSHAFLHAPMSFPLEYKLLSFSPVPSFIDGFSSIREWAEHRAMETIPYGSFAEAFLFGWNWFGIYVLFIFSCLLYLCRQWQRLGRGGFTLIFCPVYVAIFFMQTYHIRVSVRLWLFCVLSVAIADRIIQAKSRSFYRMQQFAVSSRKAI